MSLNSSRLKRLQVFEALGNLTDEKNIDQLCEHDIDFEFYFNLAEVLLDTTCPIMHREIKQHLPNQDRRRLTEMIEKLLKAGLITEISEQIYTLPNQDPGERWQRLGNILPYIEQFLFINNLKPDECKLKDVKNWVNYKLLMKEFKYLQETNQLRRVTKKPRWFEADFLDKPFRFRKLKRVIETREPLVVREISEISAKLALL